MINCRLLSPDCDIFKQNHTHCFLTKLSPTLKNGLLVRSEISKLFNIALLLELSIEQNESMDIFRMINIQTCTDWFYLDDKRTMHRSDYLYCNIHPLHNTLSSYLAYLSSAFPTYSVIDYKVRPINIE